MMGEGIEVYYDGECPLCSAWVRMRRLEAAVGPVALIDLRGDDPRAAGMRAAGLEAGLDLNAGMVVRHGGQLWHGAAAMQLLADLSAGSGPLVWLMRHPRRAALAYPVLRAGRGVLLRLLGRKPLAQGPFK